MQYVRIVSTWESCACELGRRLAHCMQAPVIGACSDAWGRRPFLLATTALGCAPPLAVLLHLRGGAPLALYYPALVLAGCVHLRTVALACLANLLPPAHRSAATLSAASHVAACPVQRCAAREALKCHTAVCGVVDTRYAYMGVGQVLLSCALLR